MACVTCGSSIRSRKCSRYIPSTTTTAGLLVGADIRRALEGRHDLDLALIPAETINDDGLFLDEERFIALRETLPMPVFPSYDFIDVLVHEGEPQLSGRSAA